MVEEKKSNFRLSGKHFIVTYKGHLKIEQLTFLKKLNTHKMFHEVGKTGYKHTHLVVCFAKKFESRNVKCFDVDGIHPNIKPIKTKVHWERAANYDEASKKKEIEKLAIVSDTLTGNEYEWLGNYRNLIQAHNKWSGVINDDYLTKIVQKYPHWARDCFENKPNQYKFNLVEEYGSLLKWQEEVMQRLECQNKRKVTWIYDKDGGNGKSELSDHLEDQKDAYIVESGNYKDIAYLWELQETIVFDLVRSSEDFTPYRAIEAFLKGRITSTKYKPVRKRLSHNRGCNIIVFANYLPDKQKLSLDRWDIGHLDDGNIEWQSNDSTNLKVPPESLNIKGDSRKEVMIPSETSSESDISLEVNSCENLKPEESPKLRKMKRNALTIFEDNFLPNLELSTTASSSKILDQNNRGPKCNQALESSDSPADYHSRST